MTDITIPSKEEFPGPVALLLMKVTIITIAMATHLLKIQGCINKQQPEAILIGNLNYRRLLFPEGITTNLRSLTVHTDHQDQVQHNKVSTNAISSNPHQDKRLHVRHHRKTATSKLHHNKL
jgi:hypothetical protein